LKKYLRNNMAKFREFYVPAGAGSNFLAKQCLWCENPDEWRPQDTSQNEFFIARVKSDAQVMSYGIRNSDIKSVFETLSKTLISPAKYYDCPDKSILSESKRIKRILIELDKFICDFYQSKETENLNKGGDDGLFAKDDRKIVIDHCDHLWREDFSVWTHSFFHLFESEHFHDNDVSGPVLEQIREVEDYFAKCREYYYDECERNNWDMFQIVHAHPFNSTSPRLKFPSNINTMAMEVDAEMTMYNNALIDIKMHEYTEDNYEVMVDENGQPINPEKLYVNINVKFSNQKVSFRKIYFENDEHEIRRIYDFFDNEDYFDKNRVQIMSEFRQYHDDNMKLVQKLTPKLYENINGRI